VPRLYCVLISMHGLVRGDQMELGKDADTGGQVGAIWAARGARGAAASGGAAIRAPGDAAGGSAAPFEGAAGDAMHTSPTCCNGRQQPRSQSLQIL
jgi:hypothetical protein